MYRKRNCRASPDYLKCAPALVQYLEFTSTEDGQHFIQRLEGFPTEVLEKLPQKIKPAEVDSMLVICRRDGKATAYINEVEQYAMICPSRSIKAGELITKNDIVDLDRLELSVPIPDDAGFLFLFSVGWRKGLVYDFGPIGGKAPSPRTYDPFTLLGQAFCHVAFQERFSISDAEWDALFKAKWFPFAGLLHATVDTLISHVRAGWNPDENLQAIAGEVKGRLPAMLEGWCRAKSFTPHIEILERAVERFQQDDFISCAGLLFPRIEGILRTHHTSLGTSTGASQDNLSDSAVALKRNNAKCLLMPHRFADYLRDVYFADFNPVSQSIEVARNSVAHGVADVEEFNLKSCILGILVVHQLFYFLNKPTPAGKSDDASPAAPAVPAEPRCLLSDVIA